MYDMHSHSNHSDDSSTPMLLMVQSAIDKGLQGIAVTDHYDPDYPTPEFDFLPDFNKYQKEMESLERKFSKDIQVIRGLEIGIQHGDTLKKCKDAASSYPYDFLIGSFHCALGKDLYVDYFDQLPLEESYHQFYQYMANCLIEYDDFDVLGHLNIIDRYAPEIPPENLFFDEIQSILRLLRERGQGIEINTSSFRYNLGETTTPTRKILETYRSIGGEILTIGSDAHSPRHVGYRLDWAKEFAKSCGFRYLAHYKNRKPIMEPID
jgi:histidinol-phosphatase (PHP family)